MKNQYQHCSQENRTVAEYSEEFHRLCARNNFSETEQHKIACFVGGLRENIKKKFNLQPLYYLTEAVALATKVEDSHGSKQRGIPNRKSPWERSNQNFRRTIDS